MKKLILNIVTLGLLFGVAVVNRNNEPKHLEVQDVLTEKEEKIGNKTRKYANETPEFKVSEVKAQVSEVYQDAGGNDRINIRFVAGIDTYTYSNAKFNLTIKDGETLVKEIEKPITVAYSAIEVNNDVLTAAEAFGDGYNYMISYALKNVPSSAWDYTFEVTAGVKTEESDYVNSEVATKNIEEIKAKDDINKPYMYIFGTVFNGEDGWSTPTKMTLTSENTYEITENFNIGTFIVCEDSLMSSTTGSKLKAKGNINFEITVSGEYTFAITRNDMSADASWTAATEVNNVIREQAYYKLTPHFEIIEEEAKIEVIYLNGTWVGDWNTYVEMPKIDENTYKITTVLPTAGGLFTAQKNRSSSGIVLKLVDGSDVKVAEAGKYVITISLVEQDETWIELKDTKANYTKSVYVKFELIQMVNLAQMSGVTAEASSTNGTVKTASKAIDGVLGDTNRWESVQKVDPQWIIVNLGVVCSISEITIQWYGNAEAKDYTIEVSIDGVEWNVIKTITGGADQKDRLDQFTFEATTAQYVKINGTARVKTYGYSINEIYIWGTK